MDIEKTGFFELGPIRPPSEGKDRSLLIRATRNCPWNKCEFCSTYKGKKFGYRRPEEIKNDIDVARSLAEEIKRASWRLGLGGRISQEVVRLQNLVNVANWLSSGGKTAFLQDANTLIMRTPELVDVIKYLKETFPSVERVTSYARSKTCSRKHLEELGELYEAGLSRLHVGLESGCDEVLEEMQKGVTAAQHIEGGKKVVKSGISLSEYVMPGLGGKKRSEKHALETAKVLNEINSDFIRIRSLVVRRGSPLFDRRESGQFEELSEDEVVDEIGIFIENLSCNSYLVSDQMSNLLFGIEGQLPYDKARILKVIGQYKAKPLHQRLSFRLGQRLRSYLGVYGGLDPELSQLIEEAQDSIQHESPDTELKTERAISALKESFI